MWDLKAIFKDFMKCNSFQEFINHRFNDENYIQVPKKYKIVVNENKLFYLDNMISTIEEAETEYIINDLRMDDAVLDIGACIGGFSLLIYDKCRVIYAVEPLMVDKLSKNCKINNTNNIQILECALGEGKLNLNFGGIKKTVVGKSLSEIINLCGGRVDFLKIDCEGNEWCIKPEELKNIRRIEAEIHTFKKNQKLDDFLDILIKAGFSYFYEKRTINTTLIHAFNNHKITSNIMIPTVRLCLPG